MNREENVREQWVLQASPEFLVFSMQTASHHLCGPKNWEMALIFFGKSVHSYFNNIIKGTVHI
jgi:hypothetical protein